MATHRIELTNTEERMCEAYLRWHARQPPGGLSRILPIDHVATVDEAIAVTLAPWWAMLAHWWSQHPEVHPQESTTDG